MLNIEHHTLEIDEGFLFQISQNQDLPGYPTPALAFSRFLESLNDHAIRHFDGVIPVILDGHGGDHIFLEHIDPLMLRDCVGKGFFRKLREHCQLNATEHFTTILRAIRGRESENSKILRRQYRTNSCIEHFLASPKNIRRAIIREALDEISTPKTHHESKLLYPLLHPLMIGCSLSYKIADLFNSTQSRVPFRDSLIKNYRAGLFNRTCKGSVTGAFQRSLEIHRNYITSLVANGYCARNELIDIETFREIYELSAKGINGLNYELMKIIMLELLISNTHSRIGRSPANEILSA